MTIRLAKDQDRNSLIKEIGNFRMALAKLRGKSPVMDKKAAEGELDEYLAKKFPIYIAEDGASDVAGYMVCRIDEDVVWVESIYVEEEFRNKGIASELYSEAERLAKELGGNAPYNWIDPNNEIIIRFLGKRGYDVLNLIELRRKEPNEKVVNKIKVGNHEFFRQ